MKEKYQIFVSYRRDGGEHLARLVTDRLVRRGYTVFFDVESLRSGDFNEALFERIAECTDVLVILPPHGLDRCAEPKDWVRLEIAKAFELEKNVIPIMMRNFDWPEKMPEDIEKLRHQNGIPASNDFFDAAIEKLISQFLHSTPANGEATDQQLQDAAERGDPRAMNELGLRREMGSADLVANQREAFFWYEKAVDAGSVGALYNLADVYEQCEKDLMLLLSYGIENLVKGLTAEEAVLFLREKAVACYEKAAEKGFLPAIFRLGNIAEEQQDLHKAIAYYRQAAERNYPPAQNALAHYLMSMYSPDYNPTAAISLYRKAADAGYAPAIFNYAHSIELTDAESAVDLYRRVFSDAVPQAAYSAARLYESALHDIREAVKFYRIALDAGIQEAADDLQRCQAQLFNSN